MPTPPTSAAPSTGSTCTPSVTRGPCSRFPVTSRATRPQGCDRARHDAVMTERPQALDELVLTVVVDNETDTLSSVDPGVPQLPEMTSLLRRTPPTRRAGHD